MFHLFAYEAPLHTELNRLPLYARMKLDIAGIKLSLNQWLGFALEERRVICHLPVDSEQEIMDFVAYVNFLCEHYLDSAAQRVSPLDPALWNTLRTIPEPVLDVSRESGRTINLKEWTRWQSYERYALYKTAVSKNEPEKFFAVLSELRQRNDES
jgi:hypothetical protein